MNRAQRRALGHRGKWDGEVDGGPRHDVRHGVCRSCGHRKLLWLPAKLCERCLLDTAQSEGLLFNEDAVRNAWGAADPAAIEAELARMEGD